jgi:hypothetical protein
MKRKKEEKGDVGHGKNTQNEPSCLPSPFCYVFKVFKKRESCAGDIANPL